ncbi:MAG: Mannitol operon activator, BglG family [uncultured Rubrobacteraceae bacterium]|uniref:Mannitol operon activator, BglG family n=1 Tax=uncultured Rubrobacteraceae bacterium TaxID=349277 RepID=A0A6J4PX54_9ACTN|nr:MAG: Mannitol operon activator, BglG family [uncultured Rubrobacteraceae bacterium]
MEHGATGLSTREVRLVEVLLRHSDGLTAGDIADRLSVSVRTVHRDLQAASDFLDSHGLTLVRQSGRGISVEGTAEAREQVLEALRDVRSSELTSEERQVSLLRTLLASDQPIKLRALASRLEVSVGTVSRDLDEAEDWLADFRLSLLRRRGYGVEVIGKEGDRRRAMSRVILQNLDEAAFLSLPQEPGESTGKAADHIADRLMGLIDEDRLREVEDLTGAAMERLPYAIADSAFVRLCVHFALMVERLLQGEKIEMGEDILQRLRKTDEYGHAQSLAQAIEEYFCIDVPEGEVAFMTMHLRGTKLRQDDTLERYFESSDLEVASRVKALIRYVEEQTGMPLAGDSSLYTGLLAHIERAIHRLQENMGIYNPLLSEIKQDYPALFDLVNQGMNKVFMEEKIPEEEVGFVAMHLGAALDRRQANFPQHVLIICPSGIGSSKMLVSKLETAFPQIQQIRHASFFELERLDTGEFDLIVSTVSLSMPEETYVQVQPFLSEDEVEKIRAHLREKSLDASRANRAVSESREVSGGGQAGFYQMVEATQTIAELIEDVFLERHEATSSIPEAVGRICGSLAGRGLVSEPGPLEAALLSRLKLGGVGIPGTALALFHARATAVVRPAFSVHEFDEALEIEGMDGATMQARRTLLMIAPQNLSPVALEAISEISAAMVEQPEAREVFEGGSDDQVVTVLQSIFANYLQDKLS